MSKPYYKKRYSKNSIRYRRNNQIGISPIRVIDEDGEQLGVIPTEKALYIAKEKGLDLVEVAPNVRPPVCKIMEWSKFKYELSKKKKSGSKRQKMKGMRFAALISDNDLEHKIRKVKEFLDKGHKVKLTVRTPRRVSISQSMELMEKVIDILQDEVGVDLLQKPRKEGFYVGAMVKKSKKSKKDDK